MCSTVYNLAASCLQQERNNNSDNYFSIYLLTDIFLFGKVIPLLYICIGEI